MGVGQSFGGCLGAFALAIGVDELDLREADDAENRAQVGLLMIEGVEGRSCWIRAATRSGTRSSKVSIGID